MKMPKVSIKKLTDDNVILMNKFTGYLYTLEHDEDDKVVRVMSDDDYVEILHEDTEIKLYDDHKRTIAVIEGNRYYVTVSSPYPLPKEETNANH